MSLYKVITNGGPVVLMNAPNQHALMERLRERDQAFLSSVLVRLKDSGAIEVMNPDFGFGIEYEITEAQIPLRAFQAMWN